MLCSRAVSLALSVAVATAGVGCKNGGGGSDGGTGAAGTGGMEPDAGFTRSQLLTAFGTCASNEVKEFRAKAAALDEALTALAGAPDASPDAARSAFREAMDVWQRLELMQFGPTGSSTYVMGGRDFRNDIYGWPTFGRCPIENALAAQTYQAPSFASLGINARTLVAIEYLLFFGGPDTTCGSTLPNDERKARALAYAAAVARDVLARAGSLDEAWDPAHGNYVETMRSAGSGSPVYATVQDAVQSVGIALFFLDTMVKDTKMTVPLNAGCTSAACFESQFAGRSKANIRANLEGFRKIVEGCDADYGGLGFDDLLAGIGGTEAAEALRARIAAALGAVDAIEEPDLPEAVVNDPASVQALRNAIGEVTTLLKTDFVTLLGFEPSLLPTDNDS